MSLPPCPRDNCTAPGETREGEKRTVFEIDVEEVGPSLAWATARVTRYGQQQAKPRQQRAADPWAGPSTEAPF